MKQWKKIVLSIVFFAMIGGMTQALAIDNMNLSPENPPGYENLWNRITRKLGRGICDTAFGVFEIPLFMSHVQFEDGRRRLLPGPRRRRHPRAPHLPLPAPEQPERPDGSEPFPVGLRPDPDPGMDHLPRPQLPEFLLSADWRRPVTDELNSMPGRVSPA